MGDDAGIHSRLTDLAALARLLEQAAQERRLALRQLQEPSVHAIARILARDLAVLRDDVERLAVLRDDVERMSGAKRDLQPPRDSAGRRSANFLED